MEKYKCIKCIKTKKYEISVEKMCEILKVSWSGYYDYLKRPESSKNKKSKIILELLKKAHNKNQLAGLESL